MKIVYCILGVGNPGGMERVLLNKVRWLCENTEHEVIIVTTDQRGQKPFYKFPDGVRLVDLGVNYTDDNGKGFIGKTLGYLRRRRLHRKRLESLLLNEKPDITISLFPCESSFIPALQDGSRKVLELHFSKNFRLQYGRSGILGFVDRLRLKQDEKLVRKFDSFVVLTEEDAANWGNLPNLSVIPNAALQLGVNADTKCKRVIAVGRLDYQKGFDRLIDIWNMVMTDHPKLADWQLDIFGQGEWRELLLNKIKDYNLSNVSVNAPTKNIAAEYAKSSILTMTSHYEGMPMVLIEAMSCGVAPVTFDFQCGPKDIIENGVNGLLVPNDNLSAFADALASLMSSQDSRKALSESARKSVERFSESVVMAQWMRLFNSITSK